MKKICFVLLTALSWNLYAQTPPAMEQYIVGSDSNYPPFQFKDGEGKFIGFEPDLLRKIGEKEGFTVKIVYSPRSEWQQKLDSGSVDIFSSALSISEKRTKVAEMSLPFLSFQRAVYILDNEKNQPINTVHDLKGKIFATNLSSYSTYLKSVELTGEESNVLKSDSLFFSLREVWAKHADAVLNNNRVFQYFGHKYDRFKYRLIYLNEPKRYFGFAVKKGRKDLIAKINKGLQDMQEDGSLDELYLKWFGVKKDD